MTTPTERSDSRTLDRPAAESLPGESLPGESVSGESLSAELAPRHRQFTGTEGVGPLSSRAIAVYSVLVAAAGFVPVPVLDDLLPQQLVRQLVRTILRQMGRRYALSFVKPLFAGDGCFWGLLGILVWLPIDFVLYPVRKFVRIIKGIRGLSQRLVSTYLLGHTVNRYVAKDWLAQDCDRKTLWFQSRILRDAFDTALKETNPVVFANSVASILGGLGGLPRAAYRQARSLLRKTGSGPLGPTEPAPNMTSDSQVDAAAAGVEQALDEPEVQSFVTEFDAVVDREVARTLHEVSAPPL